MKPFPLIAVSIFALGLAACGGGGDAADSPPETNRPGETAMEMANRDRNAGTDGTGRATGIIRSVGSQGDFLTIEHGPFEGGINMGAMTMGFDTVKTIDLSGFSDGDEVAFMVKQGRDGTYRIMAICNTATDGAACLTGLTGQQAGPLTAD